MSGGPMPYVMDKGPYLSVLEHLLNDADQRAAMLAHLRSNGALARLAGLDSTTLDDDGKTAAQRVAILNEKWFGMAPNKATGAWNKQQNQFPTGFWNGYQGDPEAILREGLTRAIEVSLGIDHGDDPSAATRAWPIDLCWVCQGPFFQCWVSWLAPSAAGDGQVHLTITSPAAEGLPVDPKITRTAFEPAYASPPANGAYASSRGVWVIGHENYAKLQYFSTTGTQLGQITMPRVAWVRTSTDVVCVSPAEWEGGVMPDGRPYTGPQGQTAPLP